VGRDAADLIRLLHPPNALETLERGVLTVAYSGDLPTDYLEDGRLAGIHGEVRRRVADLLGLEVRAVAMTFPRMLPALEAHEIDLPGIGTAWTEDRAETFLYTQPYQYFFFGVAHSHRPELRDLRALRGRTVTAIDASFNNGELVAFLGDEQVLLRPTLGEVIADLVEGRSDVAIYDLPNIKLALARHPAGSRFRVDSLRFDPDYPLTTGRFPNHFVFRRSAVHLCAAADLALDLLRASGELEAIYAKHDLADQRMLSLVPPR
jgi:polar amino acid transport system substrate-binding protein